MILCWQLKRWVFQVRFWELLFAPVGVGWTLAELGVAIGYGGLLAPLLPYFWWLLGLGLMVSWSVCWPKKSVSVKLPNIDTVVEIRVSDIFRSDAPIVVAIPTTLETSFDGGAVDPTSIQGQFTVKYFKNYQNLQMALEEVVKKATNFELVTNFYSKKNKIKKFSAGEVFVLRGESRVGYLVTFATYNSHGTAQVTASDFLDFLPRLWLGIRERGDVGNIDVPLMGSRFGRTGHDSRKDILRELVNSFSAASSEARLADRVTFYIRPSDFTKWDFSFDFIERLLSNICDDHLRRTPASKAIGTSA